MMNSMLADVVRLGTATRAKALDRSDLAGKTGTTNEQKDNWFSGFNADLITTVWVGFDNPKSLGRKEFGATTALPIWMNYMEQALANQPEKIMPQPEGLTMVKIDPVTGLIAQSGQPNAVFELFRDEDLVNKELIGAPVDTPTLIPAMPSEQPSLSPADLY
jgi:penicillin-binding protein 1A